MASNRHRAAAWRMLYRLGLLTAHHTMPVTEKQWTIL